MPLDTKAIRKVHEDIRAIFKYQFKSANKLYMPDRPGAPSPAKVHRRNQNLIKADTIIYKIQSTIPHREVSRKGFAVLDQATLAGNCGEMAAAACYLVMLRSLGSAYLVGIHCQDETWGVNHALCLVTAGSAPFYETLGEWMFASHEEWVIDPWLNVCCRIQDYEVLMRKKLAAWSSQGKFITVYSAQRQMLQKMDPASEPYMEGLAGGWLVCYRAEPVAAQPLPRHLRSDWKRDVKTGWNKLLRELEK